MASIKRPDVLLVSVAEAAVLLGIGKASLYKLVMSGEMPSLKLGKSRRIPLASLEEFITEKLGQGRSAQPPTR